MGGTCNGPLEVRAQYHLWYDVVYGTDLYGPILECHWPPVLIVLLSWPAIVGYLGRSPCVYSLVDRMGGRVNPHLGTSFHTDSNELIFVSIALMLTDICVDCDLT